MGYRKLSKRIIWIFVLFGLLITIGLVWQPGKNNYNVTTDKIHRIQAPKKDWSFLEDAKKALGEQK